MPGGQCPPLREPPGHQALFGQRGDCSVRTAWPEPPSPPAAPIDRGQGAEVSAAGLAFDPQEHGVEPESHPLGPSSGQRVGAKTPQESVEGAGAKETPSLGPGKPKPRIGKGLEKLPRVR